MQEKASGRVEVARKTQERLKQLAGHVRNDIEATQDEGLGTALETTLHVLEGLEKTFERHCAEDPSTWKRP